MVKKNKKINDISHFSYHMSNEMTFLAWVRTSVGIMAFGFVIEKFALFIKQLGFLVEKEDAHLGHHASHVLQSHSGFFGVFLVALGSLMCLLAFIRYKRMEKHIENNTYQPSMLLDVLLTLCVLLIGVFLTIYLNHTF